MFKKKKRDEAYNILVEIIYESQKVGSEIAIESYKQRLETMKEELSKESKEEN